MSSFDPNYFSNKLPNPGSRVRHKKHGEGTVITHDNYLSDRGNRVCLARVGITFDNHKKHMVNPAYFWVEDLEILP